MNKEAAIKAVSEDGMTLENVGEWNADRDVVLAAAQEEKGSALQFASAALRADKEVVMTYVILDGDALEFASRELQDDKEVVMAAVMKKGRALKYASEELKADREVVLAAVSQDGMALEYTRIQDKEIVLAAVSQTARVLLMDSEFRKDPQIACAAVRHGGYVFDWLPKSIQENNEFIACIITQGIAIPNIAADKGIPFGPDNDKFFKLKQRIRDRKSLRATAKKFKPNGKELPTEIVNKIKNTIGGTKRKRLKRKKRVTRKFAKD